MMAYWVCFVLPYIGWVVVAIAQVGYRNRRARRSEEPKEGWPLITVAVPMYNEGQSFTDSVDALLAVEYPNLELIVVDDGSGDMSFDQARRKYDLKLDEAFATWKDGGAPLKYCYRSPRYPNLKIFKQSNAGKAAALNTALRFAHGRYFMTLDADCIPSRHSLKKMAVFLTENDNYAGVSGLVRIRNGCEVQRGEITSVNLPKNWLLRCQVLEYTRSFLVARLGMFGSGHLMIMSGAFSLFRTEPLRSVNGFAVNTVGEDFDICLRLIRVKNQKKQQYLLGILPDTTCWTIAPDTISVLFRQRKRWQRGCFESLQRSPMLLINPFLGISRWINLWLFTLMEAYSPIVEVVGLGFMAYLYAAEILDATSTFLVLGFFYALCVMNSLMAIFVEVIRPGIPTPVSEILILIFTAIVEPIFFQPMRSIPRIMGTLDYFMKSQGTWGDMGRSSLTTYKEAV